METKVLLLAFVALLQGAMCDDFSVFCELVGTTACLACSSPSSAICGQCGAFCDASKTRITGIVTGNQGISSIPDSIGTLTMLTGL